MDLGLVNTFVIEKTLKTKGLPNKFISINLIIFIIFLCLLTFTLWYKYNQKQNKIKELKLNQDKLDKEYEEIRKIIEEEELKNLEETTVNMDEYIDLDGWASR